MKKTVAFRGMNKAELLEVVQDAGRKSPGSEIKKRKTKRKES